MFVIVAGAGIIGKEIVKMLVKKKHDVVVIDRDREVCEMLYAETGAMVIHGNASDILVLEEAGAAQADVIVCLMQSHADNIACSLLAKSLGIPRIIARLKDPRYEQAYLEAGVTTVASVADLLINRIIMGVEQPKVKRIMSLSGGAEIYAVNIPEKAQVSGMRIREVTSQSKFPREVVFMGIYDENQGSFQIPRGDYIMQPGYTVFLVSKPEDIGKATDILTREK
ncbi:MAG: TrkA family potassium uptake protein [Theionarchaea archaeon]|nr:TrkA family potassium uptake protein [Theionarchaea archaeon]MBU7021740.1 TrkA family potassium uptake protein [Theionarchaea archaeon]MBU7034519.1 TrkA family potassium uptake protein [Theionarchaea archaeon]MBU7041006.1 TrkA family potassium uptake protein [Theionarchaea archaeon]